VANARLFFFFPRRSFFFDSRYWYNVSGKYPDRRSVFFFAESSLPSPIPLFKSGTILVKRHGDFFPSPIGPRLASTFCPKKRLALPHPFFMRSCLRAYLPPLPSFLLLIFCPVPRPLSNFKLPGRQGMFLCVFFFIVRDEQSPLFRFLFRPTGECGKRLSKDPLFSSLFFRTPFLGKPFPTPDRFPFGFLFLHQANGAVASNAYSLLPPPPLS